MAQKMEVEMGWTRKTIKTAIKKEEKLIFQLFISSFFWRDGGFSSLHFFNRHKKLDFLIRNTVRETGY